MCLMLRHYMIFHQHVHLYAFTNKLKIIITKRMIQNWHRKLLRVRNMCYILIIMMPLVNMNMFKFTKLYYLTVCSIFLESYTPNTIKLKKIQSCVVLIFNPAWVKGKNLHHPPRGRAHQLVIQYQIVLKTYVQIALYSAKGLFSVLRNI